MIKEMIVNSSALETKVAILEDDQLAELYIERNRTRGILGNIYKGRVTKVLPGMQSAFVQIGLEKDAFLYVSDFVEDTEEYDKVFTEAEEKAETAITEIEAQERPVRRERERDRDRKPERTRWRERRERQEAGRPAPSPAPVDEEVPDAAARWNLSRETERSFENDPELAGRFIPEQIPAPLAIATALPAEPLIEPPSNAQPDLAAPPAEPENPIRALESEAPPLDNATLGDGGGEVLPFSMDAGAGAGGYNARRRGPGARRKRYTAARHTHKPERQSIDDMLREGQEILVQVAKEPIAKKGARVTSHIALPGRYLVYMPTVDHVGVSRKISSETERLRLRDVILKQRDQFQGGVIVRTAAEEHSEEDLTNDLNYLVKVWEDIRTRAEHVSAPRIIHSELNLVQRLLRDQFSFEFASIRIDDEIEYQNIVEFIDKIYPNLIHRVKLYTKDNHIFDEFGITSEIDKLLQPKIWLKSGGYIVINQTEALVSIDINTGKFVGRGNSLEETITRTNLEAVKEIVKQIRLRDLGGIIVIDFIDMEERKNRKRVMEALSQELARDKAPSKILEFNEFGLVAITRKRVKQSLERALCQPCPYCYGSGMVKSVATTCYNIYHELEKMKGSLEEQHEIMIRVHPDVARALRDAESNVLDEIRGLLDRDVLVKSDPSLHIEHFNIVT
ncbi:MAG: Rne/Rng family ribonuclease [Acidobacteriia bacterium]|nr:Rne/Rng family ribonuclease [Terriglobia bacterium]